MPPLPPDPRATPGPDPLLRNFAAGLAHNVNNALTGVIGCLDLALREATPGTGLHARLDTGLGCAYRAAEAVRRAVAFAFAARTGTPELVSLRRLAREAVEHPDNRDVAVADDDSPCWVRAGASVLWLALEELLQNARAAASAGGTVTVRTWDEGYRCCVAVADTGPGLCPEARRRLFEPFFTTKCSGHLGLGLALCREMVEARGGSIHVASAEGHGTVVTLSFPPAAEALHNRPAVARPHLDVQTLAPPCQSA